MIRKMVWAVFILLPILPLACAATSYWCTIAITYGVDRDSGERTTHSFIYPLSWLKSWGQMRNPAWRPHVLAEFGNVDNLRPYLFLEIVDGSLFVHRLKRAPRNAHPRLDNVPFLGVEELGWGELSLQGGRIWHYIFSARVPLTRLAGVLASPLMLMTIIALIRGPLRRFLRRRSGLCQRCGYDLKGNVTGVCPECGRPVGANLGKENPPEN